MNLFSAKNPQSIAISNLYIIGSILASCIAFFLIKQSVPINSKIEIDYHNNLVLQKQQLFKLSIAIARIEEVNFDDRRKINEYFQELDSINHKLLDVPSYLAPQAGANLKIAIDNNIELLKNQKQLIQNIQTNKGILNNACNSISILEKELLNKQQISEADIQYFKNLNSLIQNTLLYCMNGESSLLPLIKTKIEILNNLISNKELEELSFVTGEFLEYNQTILQYKPQIKILLEQLETTKIFQSIQEINKLYQDGYQKAIARINNYQIITFLWLLFVLVFVAYKVINNLKRTNQSIVKILENFTEELENKVEQRTAQLEESIQKTEVALAQAQEANKAKSRFLANMSHELRTPLNAILGFTQLMWRDNAISEEHQENLKIINRSGEHLLKLINDILEMSKIEVGQITLNESFFDLDIMLKSLEDMLRLKAEAKKIDLIFIKTPNTPQYIKTDEGKLRQILINLLGNALKFTEKGSITLTTKLKDLKEIESDQINFLLSDVCVLNFSVEDTGLGIEATELNRLFSPFEQTKTGLQSKEGTGLGLSICQKFVELMGGEITVESSVGCGSKFTFDILIKTVEKNTEIQQEFNLQPRQIIGLANQETKYRILVVDDVEASCLLLEKILTAVGFEVERASNGLDAIATWEQWQPHLILMDMRMPVMDGYQATERIKSQPQGENTVIIALTASAFEEERLIILSAGCDDFMRKPFQQDELLETIGNYLKLDYVYADDNSTNVRNLTSLPKSRIQLTGKSLEIMSPSWRSQLNRAATQVDNQEILKLLSEIPVEYDSLANELRILVEEFRCDKIIDLTESNNT
ncbi:MAG: response regulator [Pleurocapsa sp.]